MKISDLETIQESLNNIKLTSDKLDYNTSSTINKEIIKISPIITKEIERMDTEKITIDCPKMLILSIESLMAKFYTSELTDAINEQLKELVVNGYKIIDYNVSHDILSYGSQAFVVKYTS